MSGRFSFKRGESFSGRMRLPNTYELRYGGERLATLQEDGRSGFWFWYGDGINTAHNMRPLEAVKAEALAHFKAKPQR